MITQECLLIAVFKSIKSDKLKLYFANISKWINYENANALTEAVLSQEVTVRRLVLAREASQLRPWQPAAPPQCE